MKQDFQAQITQCLGEFPMLAGLNAIEWGRYYHAYGTASDIPGLICALTSSDNEVHERACYDLMNNLAHQGTRWEASQFAIPFLCELVKHSSTPHRSTVMNCMLQIALGDSWLDDATLPYPPHRFGTVENMLASDYHPITATMYDDNADQSDEHTELLNKLAIVWERDAYTVMSKQAHAFLILAMDDDLAVAKYAIASPPWFPVIHRDAIPVLDKLLSTHSSLETRITATLTAGLLGIPTQILRESLVHHTLASGQPHLLQLAGAIALAFLMGADVDKQVLDILVEAENWREELNAAKDCLPYSRALMGFRSLALGRLGL